MPWMPDVVYVAFGPAGLERLVQLHDPSQYWQPFKAKAPLDLLIEDWLWDVMCGFKSDHHTGLNNR